MSRECINHTTIDEANTPVKVAILGCGPAGLLAAHAASLCGHSAVIFSKKQKSPMEGAQYMHVEIPDIHTPPPATIEYMLMGSINTYRQKVYGSGDPDITVSPEQYLGSHKCWDLRATYARLWERWERRVVNMRITQETLAKLTDSYELVISTIPANVLCIDPREHKFNYVPVWIDNTWSGPTPAEAPYGHGIRGNYVFCNGLAVDDDDIDHTGWYRTSHIYGHMNTEWAQEKYVPAGRSVPPAHVWRVRKPIDTDCDCWRGIIKVGRYGLWQKGVLTHHAYQHVFEILS
jgi:hypothetical protein